VVVEVRAAEEGRRRVVGTDETNGGEEKSREKVSV
jgi:hypothetical protein